MKQIYAVFIGDFVYVGASQDASQRYVQHVKLLNRGKHYSRALQAAYNGKSELRLLDFNAAPTYRNPEQYWMEELRKEGHKVVNINKAPSYWKDSTDHWRNPSHSRKIRKSVKQIPFVPLLVKRKK